MKILIALGWFILITVAITFLLLAPIYNFLNIPIGNGQVYSDIKTYSLFNASRTVYYINPDLSTKGMKQILTGCYSDYSGCMSKEEFGGGKIIGWKYYYSYIEVTASSNNRNKIDRLLSNCGEGKRKDDEINSLLIVNRDIRHLFWNVL